ncbi:MAG TPA: hypothetical protein VKA91_03010 [Nitrososphaeraceae archaeon]|nr:hypothetical protein [Nitrososphaeraceae archaeon]
MSLKITGGIAGENNQLSYNSFTREAISIINNNETRRGQISTSDENIAITTLNNTGFFESTSFYPPAPNNTDYLDFTMFAILGNKLHAVYWTDASEGVLDAVKNFILSLIY